MAMKQGNRWPMAGGKLWRVWQGNRLSVGPGKRLPAASTRSGETGSAVVEFVFLGVVVVVPLLYLVVAVARVQAATFAVTVAAREAARAFVTSPPDGRPEDRSRAAAELAFTDQGFGQEGTIEVGCSTVPCLSPGSQVRVRAAVAVALPGAPDSVEGGGWPVIPVECTHVATVDRFRAR